MPDKLGVGGIINYSKEILELLDAIWVPKRLAVMHCQGHQRGDTIAPLGNCKAKQEANLVATKGTVAFTGMNCFPVH